MGVDKFLWLVILMLVIAVIVLVVGVFTFSLAQAASWADPDKHDLAQLDDRSKR